MLEKEIQNPDLWKDKERAVKVSQELSQLQEEVNQIDRLKEELAGLEKGDIEKFEKKLEKEELKVFLSGKYDKGPAILSVYSGAGGGNRTHNLRVTNALLYH